MRERERASPAPTISASKDALVCRTTSSLIRVHLSPFLLLEGNRSLQQSRSRQPPEFVPTFSCGLRQSAGEGEWKNRGQIPIHPLWVAIPTCDGDKIVKSGAWLRYPYFTYMQEVASASRRYFHIEHAHDVRYIPPRLFAFSSDATPWNWQRPSFRNLIDATLSFSADVTTEIISPRLQTRIEYLKSNVSIAYLALLGLSIGEDFAGGTADFASRLGGQALEFDLFNRTAPEECLLKIDTFDLIDAYILRVARSRPAGRSEVRERLLAYFPLGQVSRGMWGLQQRDCP